MRDSDFSSKGYAEITASNVSGNGILIVSSGGGRNSTQVSLSGGTLTAIQISEALQKIYLVAFTATTFTTRWRNTDSTGSIVLTLLY